MFGRCGSAVRHCWLRCSSVLLGQNSKDSRLQQGGSQPSARLKPGQWQIREPVLKSAPSPGPAPALMWRANNIQKSLVSVCEWLPCLICRWLLGNDMKLCNSQSWFAQSDWCRYCLHTQEPFLLRICLHFCAPLPLFLYSLSLYRQYVHMYDCWRVCLWVFLPVCMLPVALSSGRSLPALALSRLAPNLQSFLAPSHPISPSISLRVSCS